MVGGLRARRILKSQRAQCISGGICVAINERLCGRNVFGGVREKISCELGLLDGTLVCRDQARRIIFHVPLEAEFIHGGPTLRIATRKSNKLKILGRRPGCHIKFSTPNFNSLLWNLIRRSILAHFTPFVQRLFMDSLIQQIGSST